MARPDPEKEEDLLRQLYERDRLSLRKIAEKWDVAPSTVLETLRRYGIETRKVRTPADPALLNADEVVHLYRDLGLGIRAIARRLTYSRLAVQQVLDEARVTPHPVGRPRPPR